MAVPLDDKLAELRAAGMTYVQLSEEFGLCITEVRRRARRAGAPLVHGTGPARRLVRAAEARARKEQKDSKRREERREDLALIAVLHADGLTYRQIDEALQVPAGTSVQLICRYAADGTRRHREGHLPASSSSSSSSSSSPTSRNPA
jgi:hypothetical protein